MAKRHDVEVTDEQWEKIRPHLPERKRSREGGRIDRRPVSRGLAGRQPNLFHANSCPTLEVHLSLRRLHQFTLHHITCNRPTVLLRKPVLHRGAPLS